MKTLRAVAASWGFIFLGGLSLGAANPDAEPIIHMETINWSAIAAMASVAGALALLNWFIIRQAVASAVLVAELKMKDELDKYVTKEFCKTKHWDTERRVEILEDQGRTSRFRHTTDQQEDNRRLDVLENRD